MVNFIVQYYACQITAFVIYFLLFIALCCKEVSSSEHILDHLFKRVQSLGACDNTYVSGTFVCVCVFVFPYAADTTANKRIVKDKM